MGRRGGSIEAGREQPAVEKGEGNEEDEEVFDVLKCVDKRTKNGTVEYLVRCECAGCCAAIESCPLLLLTGPCVPPMVGQGKGMTAMTIHGNPW